MTLLALQSKISIWVRDQWKFSHEKNEKECEGGGVRTQKEKVLERKREKESICDGDRQREKWL